MAAFYRDVFGLAEITRHRAEDGSLRSIWLDLGSAILMIERTGEPARHVEGVGAGAFLLAFRIAPGARAGLERALGAIESRTEHTSYARDPEGNRVAISSYPLEAGETGEHGSGS